MSPLPLPFQTLDWLNHAADAGQRDAQVLLHLIDRVDKHDQDVAVFVDSYSKTIAALCRRLDALERGANDLTAAPDPVEPEIEICETCDGEGTIDERLGGISTSNPAATCPDCDGVGKPRRFHRQPPAAPTPPPTELVEVVGNELPLLPDGRVDEARTRAAIRKMADWLDTQGHYASANVVRRDLDR
jgi:hypothetical protein